MQMSDCHRTQRKAMLVSSRCRGTLMLVTWWALAGLTGTALGFKTCSMPRQEATTAQWRHTALIMSSREDDGALGRREVIGWLSAASAILGSNILRSPQRSWADEEEAALEPAAPPAVETEALGTRLSPKEELLAKNAYDFEMPFNTEKVPLSKFKGKVALVVNTKSDDPEALNQIPGLTYLNTKYYKDGLKIWVFPTEQGTFETDEERVIRIKYYTEYGFGQYPNAVLFDKVNVVGKGADPFFKWLCLSLRNPNRIARITLNFEKFLVNEEGKPVRRYPRRYSAYDIEPDIEALMAGKPLPPPTPKFLKAWRDAAIEAERSEYAFKKGLNWYDPLGEDQRDMRYLERGSM